MSNPWLAVPLSDYEGHMNSPEVQQLSALADLFAEALARCRPVSVAILGIAGGNGLDRIDSGVTKRIVGLDCNPTYLDAVQARYPFLPGLDLHCVDLAGSIDDLAPVQMVHVALVFEHAGTDRCLDNALALVEPGGSLAVVLQLPTTVAQAVAATPFPSMQNLKTHFTLIDSAWLSRTLEARGFHLVSVTQRSLPAGKAFWMGFFRRK